MVEWLKKAPTSIIIVMIIVCGVIALGVLGAFVLLSIQGVDTTDLRQWVQTLGILIFGPLLGVNTVTGIVAARSASRAEDQTNGQLTTRDERIAELEDRVQRLGGTIR